MAVAWTVELLLNGAWVDITADVRLNPGVAVKVGVGSESGTADPATCSLVVNNRDGRYSPRNAAGPYYGHLSRNTPLRFTVGAASRFYGEVSEFPSRWNLPGTDVWSPLVASGVLRRMVRANAIRSPLDTGVSGLGANLTGYWTMEDGAGGAFGTTVPGASALSVFGTVTPAAIPLGASSDPVAELTAGGAAGTARTSASLDFYVAAYLSVPSAGMPDGTILLQWTTTGTPATGHTWQLCYELGGTLRLRVYSSIGAVLLNQSLGFVSGLTALGRSFFWRIRAQNSGVNVALSTRLRLDGEPSAFVNSDGWESAGGWSVPGTQLSGAPTTITVNPDVLALEGVGIGHIIVGDTYAFLPDSSGTPNANLFLTSYAGETVAARLTRVAAVAGVALSLVAGTTDGVGPQPDGTALDVMRAAEAADTGGILYDSIDALGLAFIPRHARYDATQAELALLYTSGHLSPPLDPTDDDANIRNDVTVTRTGGATARAVDTTSAVNANDYPVGIGAYPHAVTLNVATDLQVPQAAGWLLNLGTVDETRYPQLTVDLVANPGLVAAANALRPGHRVRVSGLPAWMGDTDVDLHAIGWTEVVGSHTRTLTLNCVPAPPFHVVKLDDSTGFGTIDTLNKLAL